MGLKINNSYYKVNHKKYNFQMFLKIVTQAAFRSVENGFQVFGSVTEKALEPTDDDTRGISYTVHCLLSAEALYLEVPREGTTAC